MLLETRRLSFKKVLFILEKSLPEQKVLESKYSSVTIVSHNKLNLAGWRVLEKMTTVVDLTPTEEEIFRKFNDTTRNEIRRTIDNPAFRFDLNARQDEIYDLYVNFERSQGRHPSPKSDVSAVGKKLAYVNGKPVYGLFTFESYPHLRVRSIFSQRLSTYTKDELKLISNAGRALMWHAMLEAKAKGFETFDLAVVNFEDPKKENLRRFKLSFGGDVMPEYTYMYRAPIFRFFESMIPKIRAIKSMVLK